MDFEVEICSVRNSRIAGDPLEEKMFYSVFGLMMVIQVHRRSEKRHTSEKRHFVLHNFSRSTVSVIAIPQQQSGHCRDHGPDHSNALELSF